MASAAAVAPTVATRAADTVAKLCAADFAGRRVVSAGHELSRDWLAAELEQLGCAVEVRRFKSDANVLELAAPLVAAVDDRPLEARIDVAEHPRSPAFAPTRGRVVSRDEPAAGAWIALEHVPNTDELTALVRDLFTAGAVGVLAPRPSFSGYLAKQIGAGVPVSLPLLLVRADLLPTLPGRRFEACLDMNRLALAGDNVLGWFGARRGVHAREPLLLAAHYDGVGDDPGLRLPGAADNASGVAAVLEVARLLTAGAPYARPLAIAFLDAEEVNAQGSRALATELVAQGLRGLVLNLDMAARYSGRVAVEAGPGARPLLQALDRAGRQRQIPLEIAPVASDNRRFAGAGLVAVGVALGGDHYHTPADIPATVESQALEVAVALLAATANGLLA